MDKRHLHADRYVMDAGAPHGRRAWSAPVLRRHESLTVLTQSVIGPGVPFLLQIGCSAVGGCLPSPNHVPPGAGPPPGYGPGAGTPNPHAPFPQ